MSIDKFVERCEEGFISLLLVGMTLLVFAEVILRFVFSTGFIWMEEVTLTVAAWFVLFGMSYGLKVGAHIGVDAFVRLMPNKVQRVCTAVAILICLVYCSLFLYGGWIYLGKLHMIGLEMEDLPLPKWGVMSILFIGFVLLSLRLLNLLWQVITGETYGFKHTDEAEESMQLARQVKEESEVPGAAREPIVHVDNIHDTFSPELQKGA